MKVRLVLDKAAIERELKSRTGATGAVTAGFAGVATRTVKEVAREKITPRTGAYIDGIKSSYVQETPNGPSIDIEATAAISIILEDGSRAHVITGNPWLASRERNFGPVRAVNHPGTPAFNIVYDGIIRAAPYFGRLGN